LRGSVRDATSEVNDIAEAAVDTDNQALWRALQPLRSVATWLMVGAHPDDEWNGFLAWLAYGRGVHTIYACSTRGEGGQSTLGPERGPALGAIRSREMELAAGEISLALRWLGAGPEHGPNDPIHDFGFSRSGIDTLQRWGEARLTERLVRLIRTEMPDAISPTFLDVPGQHGHHRAMTWCTLRAVALAADPAFLPGLPPWKVAKTYLPAYSGAGLSYDDEQPPPPETTRVDLGEHVPELGMNWAQWGERSRRFHASQGMGRDLPPGPRLFKLHLASGAPDTSQPMDGIAHSLADLAGLLPRGHAADALVRADAAITGALASFPNRAEIATGLHEALGHLAGVVLPDGDIAHRVALKRRQLGHAAASALCVGGTLTFPDTLRAGEAAMITLTSPPNGAPQLRLQAGWHATEQGKGQYRLQIPADAQPFGTIRDSYDPLGGSDFAGITLRWSHAGSEGALDIDPTQRLCLAPVTETRVTPHRLVRRTDSNTPVLLRLEGSQPPASWPLRDRQADRLEILAPPGRLDLESAGLALAISRSQSLGVTGLVEPATASILRADIAISSAARVGIIAGATDETLFWLRQLDIAAEPVDDETLAQGDLSRFTTLLVGIFGFVQRPALLTHRERIIDWTHNGGSLVTMYHRPEDGWNEGRTPPLRLLPGRPSLRWRVTDPAAPFTILAPDHPLLTTPNAITSSDWDGWVRERGLYFASEWDKAYVPLLQMADPGEPSLNGALLAAPFGAGRHVHVALALHHQLRALVPGAFRLLANLVAETTSGTTIAHGKS
jgi:LmbE family N-acetylglucosaminyl deacetylase